MPDIKEQISNIKILIGEMKETLHKIKEENDLLRIQQTNLVAERATLIKKNEYAKEQIESIIERLKSLEEHE